MDDTNSGDPRTTSRLVQALRSARWLSAAFAAFVLCSSLTEAIQTADAEFSPVDTPIRSGMARLVVDIQGLPDATVLSRLPADREILQLRFRAKLSLKSTTLSVTAESALKVQFVDVPADEWVFPTVSVLGEEVFLGHPIPSIRLDDNSTHRVTINVGLSHSAFVTLMGVPLVSTEGLRISGPAPRGSAQFPGRPTATFVVNSETTLDASGQGWLAVASPSAGEARTPLAERIQLLLHGRRVSLKEVEESPPSANGHVNLVIEPAGQLIFLMSAPGTTLRVSAMQVMRPSGTRSSVTRGFEHVDLLPRPWPQDESFSVFVNGVRQGSVRHARMEALSTPLESSCISVDDLPFETTRPNLSVAITGLGRYPVAPSGWRLTLTPTEPRFPYFRRSEHRYDQLSILGRGESNITGHCAGLWSIDEDGSLTANAVVPPGDYFVHLSHLDLRGDVLQQAPVRVEEDSTQLTVDLGKAKTWYVVPRTAEGKRPRFLASEADLWIGGTCAWMSSPIGPSRDWPLGLEPPFATIHTLDGRPRHAILGRSPGANGWTIELRPTNVDDRVPGANLIAIVPDGRRVYGKLNKVAGGIILGYTEGTDRTLEPDRYPVSIGGRGVRTVSMDRERGVSVVLRNPSARGVILEEVRNEGPLVRDWFHATHDGVTLLGGGEGRWDRVTSELEAPCMLVLIPRDPEG
ncbi:MAG: hypothetical protein AAGG01_21270, partial [Planctomycetota bacterium]